MIAVLDTADEGCHAVPGVFDLTIECGLAVVVVRVKPSDIYQAQH
jgi:hypothetical protein